MDDMPEKAEALVIRGLKPIYHRAFRMLATMYDLTYADLLVLLLVRSKLMKEVPASRVRPRYARPASARPTSVAAGR